MLAPAVVSTDGPGWPGCAHDSVHQRTVFPGPGGALPAGHGPRDTPPYRGVRGQARASVIRGEGGRLLGELIDRYVGARDSRLARRLLTGAADEVTIRITPTRLASWDYTERMRGD